MSSASGSGLSIASDSLLPTDTFSEADVQELVGSGFERKSVIFELRQAQGDKKKALAALLAKSLKF